MDYTTLIFNIAINKEAQIVTSSKPRFIQIVEDIEALMLCFNMYGIVDINNQQRLIYTTNDINGLQQIVMNILGFYENPYWDVVLKWFKKYTIVTTNSISDIPLDKLKTIKISLIDNCKDMNKNQYQRLHDKINKLIEITKLQTICDVQQHIEQYCKDIDISPLDKYFKQLYVSLFGTYIYQLEQGKAKNLLILHLVEQSFKQQEWE